MRSNPSPVRTRLSHRRQFSVIAKMNQLKPPLAVVERDDEDFMFFSSIDDVLGDPFDVLWGKRMMDGMLRGSTFRSFAAIHRIAGGINGYHLIDRFWNSSAYARDLG